MYLDPWTFLILCIAFSVYLNHVMELTSMLVPAHLTNGLQSFQENLKKKEALAMAKDLRAKGVFASVYKQTDGKMYSVFIPR